jgi:YVTN family beta-propeller protein
VVELKLRLVFVLSALLSLGIFKDVRSDERFSTPDQRTPFVSPHFRPVAFAGSFVFVVNTPQGTLDVIDSRSYKVVKEIPVGVEPVSVAIRPDGREVWVANHVSDSISVVDNDPLNPTYWNVVATIQDFDEKAATQFDEPVGIAFANNEKAYVALSSENKIAVIDVGSRKMVRRLSIPAQDPRAIVVAAGKLWVVPFESNNQTQLSGGSGDDIDGDLVTFDAWQHSIVHNNVLSLGHVVDIVKHPRVPDRDLFVFDTETDRLIQSVDTLGTLLYGLAVDSTGKVFIAQTDARNDVNGKAGTKKHDLSQLENRPFLNQITKVEFDESNQSSTSRRFELEPVPPQHPSPQEAFATPYAVEVSGDNTTLVVVAAGSDSLMTLDANSGKPLGRIKVGGVPRGLVLEESSGKLNRAWVFNAVENSVTVVDLTDREDPKRLETIALMDPTEAVLKRGRIAFETAASSSTRTFSCSSCHPDGHTDQLLWVLKTPVVSGGNQIMPRSTMPLRGLRDTEPYHWDGVPGDPYGGNNSANVHGSDPPNSVAGDALSSIRHLIDAGLSSTMVFAGEEATNDAGKIGFLSEAQRNDLGEFLLDIPYPPAQRRPYTNEVTDRARQGFELFHILGDEDPSKPRPNVCGDCHRMPFLVSTNTPGTGMDAPTWRGAYDRFLILPQGRLNLVEFPFYRRVTEQGQSEEEIWRFSWGGRQRFNPVWDMVLEMSTGMAGAFGRQVTLSPDTIHQPEVQQLWSALEEAAADEAIVLRGVGVRLDSSEPHSLEFRVGPDRLYRSTGTEAPWKRNELLREIEQGRMLVTFTAHAAGNVDDIQPQPAIWTLGPIEKQRGHQKFPQVYPGHLEMIMSGRHINEGSRIYLNGRRVEGNVELMGEGVTVRLAELPPEGLHLLQLQNLDGQFTNDFIMTSSVTVPDAEVEGDDSVRSLGDILKRSEWEGFVGEWVDEGSDGEGLKFSVRWKFKNRVLETQSVSRDQKTVSLIALDAANGDVYQVGADDQGGSHLGKWEFKKKGPATLSVGYTSGDGSQGELSFRYELVGPARMVMTLQLPEPVLVRMKRVK